MVYLSGARKRKKTVEAEKKSQVLLTKIPKVTTFFSSSRKPYGSLTLENIGDHDPVIAETSVIDEADPVAETSFIVDDEIPPWAPSTTRTSVANVRSCESIKILSGTPYTVATCSYYLFWV
jgi:hypothetical protein